MNFPQLIFSLYRSGEITFDDDGAYNLSPLAVVDIQRHIAPTSIINYDLDGTVAFMTIRAIDEAQKQQEEGNRLYARLLDVEEPAQLKHAIFNHAAKCCEVH